jgi:hypothetical protein
MQLLAAGCILTFLGTFSCYVWYSATEQNKYRGRHRAPLPLLTDMFTDWPVASSATMGAGTTLLFTAMSLILQHEGKMHTASCSVAQASCWLMISTSYAATMAESPALHNLSVFGFVASSTYTSNRAGACGFRAYNDAGIWGRVHTRAGCCLKKKTTLDLLNENACI